MNLSELSRTAILTLICRVVASEKNDPVFNDPMAVLCLERLMSIAPEEEKKRMLKWRKIECRSLQNLFEDAWREKRVAIKSIQAVEGCVRKVAAENAA